MVGRLFYRFRTVFRDGVSTAYWREIMRRKILGTPAVPDTDDLECEIHVLTSADDWLNLLWALKSFYRFSQRRYSLCIHDDGSLPPTAIAHLRTHFPAARLISREQADRDVLPTLVEFPRCHELRSTNTLSLKIFDFSYYLRSSRMLLLDSDVLFFDQPKELLRRIEDGSYIANSVNPDVASAYTVDPAEMRNRFNFDLQPLFNSGLGLIHRDSLRLDWIEEFLSLTGVLGHFWRIEQTLFALSSFRYGAELLPAEYAVRLEATSDGKCCKHYVGAIRRHMYDSGLPKLVQSGFLKPVTPAFAAEVPQPS